jgi:hypothetical protein
MRSLARVVIVIGLGALACQAPKPTKRPSPRLGLRLTTDTIARQHSRQALRVDVRFALADRGLNGTGLLLAFLQRMETYRAAYVSDLSYSLQMTYNGMTIECVSKIRVDDGTPDPGEPEAVPEDDGDAEYTTTVKPWRPRETDAWVVDRDMVCKRRAQQVLARTPRYDNTYAAEHQYSLQGRPLAVDNTAIVHYDECTYQGNRRFVHRYEHFVAARFTPPDLDVIRRHYADHPLVHEPPLCHQIQLRPGQELRQHIDADVHFPPDIVPDRDNIYIPMPPVPSHGGD